MSVRLGDTVVDPEEIATDTPVEDAEVEDDTPPSLGPRGVSGRSDGVVVDLV